MRIVVCDDDTRRAQSWSDRIGELAPEGSNVITLSGKNLADVIESVSRRDHTVGGPVSPIDEADLLILDSNLTPDLRTARTLNPEVVDTLSGRAGETLAYQARVRSKAKYIVVVNQTYSERTFDLTFRRFSSGYADLYVSAKDLVDPALWGRYPPPGGYRPWTWPDLRTAHRVVNSSRRFVADLDRPFLGALNLEVGELSADHLDVLGDQEPTTARLRHLATSPLGFSPADRELGDEETTRMVASVLTRWAERVLIASQTVLADAPHLAVRFPGLFDTADLGQLTVAVRSTRRSDFSEKIRSTISPVADFTARPIFHIGSARAVSAASQKSARVGLVWAEDTSRFIEPGSATEVLTGFQGAAGRRYIEKVKQVRYLPKVRIL